MMSCGGGGGTPSPLSADKNQEKNDKYLFKKKNDLENVEIVDKPMFFHKKLQLFDNLAAAAAASAEARFGCLVTNVSMLNETRLVLVIFSDIVLPRKKIA